MARAILPAACAALLLSSLAAGVRAQDDRLGEGIRLLEQQRWTDARATLLPLAEREPHNPHAVLLLGRAFLEEGNFDRAAHWLERAVRLEPSSPEAHLYLASAYGNQAQRAGIARRASLAGRTRSHLERAVALDPDNARARYGLVQFHVQAPGIVGGNRQKAREQVDQLRTRNPYFAALAAAVLHNADGNWAAAEREFRSALLQFPDSTPLHFGLASALVQQARYEHAVDTYERLLAARPDQHAALYHIGRVGAIAGIRLERAEQALVLWLGREPQPPAEARAAAYWRLGMVLDRQGRSAEARQAYETTLRLDPRHAEARKALRGR